MLQQFEESFRKDLVNYLQPKNVVGDPVESTPDLEQLWVLPKNGVIDRRL